MLYLCNNRWMNKHHQDIVTVFNIISSDGSNGNTVLSQNKRQNNDNRPTVIEN